MKTNWIQNLHFILLGFLGICALFGGVTLIVSPSGKLLGGLPLSLLEHSPFDNFLIPAIILAVVLGILPLFIIWGLMHRPALSWADSLNIFGDMFWAWSYGFYIAFALLIWMAVEAFYIQGFGWLQLFYTLYVIPLVVLPLMPQIRNNYSRDRPIVN